MRWQNTLKKTSHKVSFFCDILSAKRPLREKNPLRNLPSAKCSLCDMMTLVIKIVAWWYNWASPSGQPLGQRYNQSLRRRRLIRYLPSAVCSLCGMFPLRYVPSAVCSLCGMFPLRYVPSAICSKPSKWWFREFRSCYDFLSPKHFGHDGRGWPYLCRQWTRTGDSRAPARWIVLWVSNRSSLASATQNRRLGGWGFGLCAEWLKAYFTFL